MQMVVVLFCFLFCFPAGLSTTEWIGSSQPTKIVAGKKVQSTRLGQVLSGKTGDQIDQAKFAPDRSGQSVVTPKMLQVRTLAGGKHRGIGRQRLVA